MMIGFSLLSILLVVGAIALVIGAIAYVGGWRPQFAQGLPRGNAAGRDSSNNAQEILDERYARGEITRDEYQRMQQDLGD